MNNQSKDTEKQPLPYAVLGGPCGLPLKPVDYDEFQSEESGKAENKGE